MLQIFAVPVFINALAWSDQTDKTSVHASK